MLRHPSTPHFTLPPSTTPPAFPGLVSSLRPLKRISTQLQDESTLLRRFTYKNKNQFKGTGWWRKLVEVDRATARAVDELRGLLGEFGIEAEKDEPGLISREAVCKGLLRLPRTMLVVEKTIDSLLGCASILEQLIHSRAFLAFALVVVALVARLHSLFTVLFDELSRTSGVLVKLVELNGLLPALSKLSHNLPRDLRRFLPLDPSGKPTPLPASTSSVPPSSAATPLAASPGPSADDLGAVISRSALSAKPVPSALSSLPTPSLSTSTSRAASPAPSTSKPKKKRSAPPSEAPSRTVSPLPSLPPDLPTSALSTTIAAAKPAKRPRIEPVDTAPLARVRSATSGVSEAKPVKEKEKQEKKEEKVKVKKKVKKRKSGGRGDEIDAIFG